MGTGPATARTPLTPSFWRLFASSSTSNLSDGVLQAALPLLAATLTRDPVAVSALGALAFLPWLLLAIPAGTLVDRVDRRAAMAVANTFRGVVLVVLAGAVLTDHASMPLLYVAAFLLGCAETVYDSAARAMLPRVVARAQLERGNSLLATAESVGNIFLGAPLGAWLFAVAVALPLWTNALGYLLAALVVLTVAGRFRPERVAVDLDAAGHRRGAALAARHAVLRSLLAITAVATVLHSLTSGILVLFALQDLGLSERGFGLMLAAGGVGAITGSLLSPYLTSVLGRTHAMGLSGIVAAGATLVMGVWPQAVVGAVCFAVSAGSISVFNVQVMSVRQALVPEHLFGRVQGAYRTVLWGGIPLGTLGGGILGSWLGLPAVFLCSGVGGVLVGLVTWSVLTGHRQEIARAFAGE